MLDTSMEKQDRSDQKPDRWYMIRFRENEHISCASSRIRNLKIDEVVMAQTGHGLEPARIINFGLQLPEDDGGKTKALYSVTRRGTREEIAKYDQLVVREKEAFYLCRKLIKKFELLMKLIKVERFFNGSKIIFYFTSDIRVDFRELVKTLVQEFRTKVEMRQIGVRHETKMIGGLGCCGRELCCSSFIKKFTPVSIKMAKEQNLPLNPAKISGICNRLLCCLSYEYDVYHKAKKHMPRIGKNIALDEQNYKVLQHNVVQGLIKVVNIEDRNKTLVLTHKDWERAVVITGKPRKLQKKDPKKDKS
ncbi:MAG: regulatory iron-sulfur-containing complex subunit RicT [Thermodesulfobacteriota bacterium]|nr:regulatory iron-sulfur-containing complex subunit RicT [Thermodesulfobacteriota bacterium]